MDLRDYYNNTRISKNRGSRSDRADSWRQKRTLSSNLGYDSEKVVAFQEPTLKKGKPETNAFQSKMSINNGCQSNASVNSGCQSNAFRNCGFQTNNPFHNTNTSHATLLSSGFNAYHDRNNNAQTEQAWKGSTPFERLNPPPGLISPLLLASPIASPFLVRPDEMPIEHCSFSSDNTFFGHSSNNAQSLFQQQQNGVADHNKFQAKDCYQQQTGQLFNQHPYLKGVQMIPNDCNPPTAIRNNPTDTEMSEKTTWSKVVAGERSTPVNSSFPCTSEYQSNNETMMYCDTNQIVSSSSNLLRSTSSVVKPGCHSTKYLTDSVSYIASNIEVSANENCSIVRPYTVVKISNIPWSVDTEAIKKAFRLHPQIALPEESMLPQCVHVMMDVKTGKTLGTAYAEVIIKDGADKQKALDAVTFLPVQGRRIHFTESSYDEVCNEIFSDWNGKFKNGMAIPSDNWNVVNGRSSQLFIGQKDLQSLLNVCRLYKVHYNRKCPERPFEYLITLLMYIPWKQPRAVTTIQRDIIYECYKLATEALRSHTYRSLQSFNDSILPRLVKSAILCNGFTVKQKNGVLTNSKLECPPDLKYYLQEPLLLSDPNYSTFMS